MLDGNETEIEVVQRVKAPPEIVFSYFTDPVRMAQWIDGRAELDPRPGGRYRIEMTDGGVVLGDYREIDPPRRLVLSWGQEGSASMPPGSSIVDITLTPDRDGTIVHLRHRRLPDATARRQHTDGWTVRLGRLAGLG